MTSSPVEPPQTIDTPHPAKFSDAVMDVIRDKVCYRYLAPRSSILDPFAGVGGIHQLAEERSPGILWDTYAIEIEPEWAAQSARLGDPWATWCGDFFEFCSMDLDDRPWRFKFDAIVTSPTYGNRMADHHNARDASKRITYRHKLGRPLTENNSGMMQWGDEYKLFHGFAWKHAADLLDSNGDQLFVLNVSNHVRGGLVVPVVRWHRRRLERLGFELLEDHKVPTPRMRFGQNGEARVECEHVLVFRKGAP